MSVAAVALVFGLIILFILYAIVMVLITFWYITIPAIALIIIYKKRKSIWKPNNNKRSSYKGTPPYQGKYYSKGEEELLTGRNPQEKPWQGQSSHNGSNYYQSERGKLLKMLESIGLSEEEAKLVFGKDWKRKLTKSGYDDQFASEMLKIQTKIMFDLDYRKEIIHLVDKLISTIDFVINAFPETAKKYAKNLGPYEEIYIHQWEIFKKYKKTSFEINSENELTVSEAYKILELGITATIEQVKKRFRVLALKWHPDRNRTNKTQAEQMFVKINKAYETIIAAA
jgi:DnaJ-domain-containing protein 1